MKTTGITRRIDELGRIVIPKEIRKNMHLKTGELLEIFLDDSETITLKKHSIIGKNEEFLQYYVKTLANKLNADVYITTLSDVAFSSDLDTVGEKLSNKLDDLISNNINFSSIKTIELTNNKKLENSFIYSLRPNGDLSGLLILNFDDNDFNENSDIIKFSTAFLEEYFENN